MAYKKRRLLGGSRKGEDAHVAERRVKVFELFKLGMSYRQIQAELGGAVSLSTIGADIHATLDELGAQRLELAARYVDLELRRLDDMTLVLAPRAKAGDDGALDRLLRVMERRSRLLGLDKPEKVEHTGTVRLEDLVSPAPAPTPTTTTEMS